MNDEPTPDRQRGSHARRWLRFLPVAIVVAGIALGYGMGWHERLTIQRLVEDREALKQFVADNAALAPVAYIAFHASAVALSFPAAALLTVISGFLFGWLAGALYAIIAAMAGGTALFLAARTAFGDLFRKRADKTLGKLARDFKADAFAWVFVLRLAPFIPFAVASIAPALFNVRVTTFMVATLLGILPGAFAYAWLGHGLDSVLMAADASEGRLTLADLATPEITAALLALTLVAVLATIVRKRRGTRTP